MNRRRIDKNIQSAMIFHSRCNGIAHRIFITDIDLSCADAYCIVPRDGVESGVRRWVNATGHDCRPRTGQTHRRRETNARRPRDQCYFLIEFCHLPLPIGHVQEAD